MKRALITALIIWIAAMAAYYGALRSLLEWPGNLIAAVLGGTFLAMFLGALRGWWQGRADVTLIRQALAGQPLQDGRRAAVPGRLLVTGAALPSPVSGTLCALYEYDVAHTEEAETTDSEGRTDTRKSRVVDFSGVGMAPCVVESLRGRVGLSGFPMLEPVTARTLSRKTGLNNLSRHFTSHPAVSTKLTSFGALTAIFSHHDTDAFQRDWHFTKASLGQDDQEVTEKRIEPGANVVVLGRYEAEKQALVGRDGRKASYNLLHLGAPEEVTRQIGKKGRVTLVVAFLFFAVFHAGLGFALQRSSHFVDNVSEQQSRIYHLAEAGDGAALNAYVLHHTTPQSAGPILTALLCDARTPERARLLIEAGADPNTADPRTGSQPLMTAVRYGQLGTVDMLLKRGANPRIEETRTRHPLLLVAHKLGRDAIVERLKQEGLEETWVTAATGQPLPAEGGEPFAACVKYLAAVQRADVPAMTFLTSRNTGTTYEGVDFDVWKKYRPTHPRLIKGYLRTHASEPGATQTATLSLMDPDPALSFLTWNYDMLYEDGQWKIYAEWSVP